MRKKKRNGLLNLTIKILVSINSLKLNLEESPFLYSWQACRLYIVKPDAFAPVTKSKFVKKMSLMHFEKLDTTRLLNSYAKKVKSYLETKSKLFIVV